MRVTCLSDLNSTECLSFLHLVPSELKSTLTKMLTLLTRIPICCLEGLWLAYCNKGGLRCHIYKYILRAKRRKDGQNRNSASTIKTAAAVLNHTGPQSMEYITTFLQSRT